MVDARGAGAAGAGDWVSVVRREGVTDVGGAPTTRQKGCDRGGKAEPPELGAQASGACRRRGTGPSATCPPPTSHLEPQFGNETPAGTNQGHENSPHLLKFSSVAQPCPTLRPHGLQHVRPPCLSPTPGVYSNSCPLSW